MRFTLHAELRVYPIPSYGHPPRRRCPDEGGLSVHLYMVACNSGVVCMCSVVRRWNALFLHVSSSLLDGMYMIIVHERDNYDIQCTLW